MRPASLNYLVRPLVRHKLSRSLHSETDVPAGRPSETDNTMPKILDWRRTANAPALAQFAAHTLAEGALVALPTERGYSLAASALLPEAVARLRGSTVGPNAQAPTPALCSGADALHWAPDLGRMGRRLSRRFWPGPLTLVCNEGVENGLAYQLSEAVRRTVCSESGDVRLRAP